MSTNLESSPLMLALLEKKVNAEVIDVDHYRIRGGMAVETDYIIRVSPTKEPTIGLQFETFTLSKTYSAFRTLSQQLNKCVDNIIIDTDTDCTAQQMNMNVSKLDQNLIQYCESVMHLIESERTAYLGKVNYNYVKGLAKRRTLIINHVLGATLNYFPEDLLLNPTDTTAAAINHNNSSRSSSSSKFHLEIAEIINTFFLMDHCSLLDDDIDDNDDDNNNNNNNGKHNSKNQSNEQNSITSQSLTENANTTTSTTPTNFNNDDNNNNNNLGNTAIDAVGQFFFENWGKRKSRLSPSPIITSPPLPPPKEEKEEEDEETITSSTIVAGLKSPVVPYTRKSRRPSERRKQDERELTTTGTEANFFLDDDRQILAGAEEETTVPSYTHPIPNFSSTGSKIGDLLENNPYVFAVIAVSATVLLRYASDLTVAMDLDILLLLIWASFCVGLHTPRPLVGGMDVSIKPIIATTRRTRSRSDINGRKLLRLSMASTPTSAAAAAIPYQHSQSDRMDNKKFSDVSSLSLSSSSSVLLDSIRHGSAMLLESIRQGDDEGEDDVIMDQSPLPEFPDGAALGSKLNCWSEPVSQNFKVRGQNYLQDNQKIPSGSFVFPIRAVDLFLTDTCPENAGSIPGVLGGDLRRLPTFIINFRLPWGILLFYFEIPERFLPFLKAGHEPDFDESSLPSLDNMNSIDRCVARFLQGSQEHKNSTLKIVPSVVEGPWIVKSVVGAKPAIIGNKMPVNYYYQKQEEGKACYLEADLDIVASAAARGILSCVRSYTQSLTIDLGFVVQGNENDELPEQMLVGARLHGIDPINAPPLPPYCADLLMNHQVTTRTEGGDEDDSDNDSRISYGKKT